MTSLILHVIAAIVVFMGTILKQVYVIVEKKKRLKCRLFLIEPLKP